MSKPKHKYYVNQRYKNRLIRMYHNCINSHQLRNLGVKFLVDDTFIDNECYEHPYLCEVYKDARNLVYFRNENRNYYYSYTMVDNYLSVVADHSHNYRDIHSYHKLLSNKRVRRTKDKYNRGLYKKLYDVKWNEN